MHARSRRLRAVPFITAALVFAAIGAASADDVSGASTLLCASAQATVCTEDGVCDSGPPWSWNIPAFIEIDLDERVLRTTEASRENRRTPIRTVEKEGGVLYLQGVEGGRAFSFVIDEDSGRLAVAVARDGVTVNVFGSCTTAGK